MIRIYRFIFAVLLSLAVIWTGETHQHASAQVEGTPFKFRHVQEWSPDPLSIDDVCCDAGIEWGAPGSLFRGGVGGPPVWIELPSLRPGSVIELTQIVDEVILFEGLPDGEWRTSRTGDSVTTNGQGLPVARMAFLLSEELPAETRRYLRVKQPNLSAISIVAWDVSNFQANVERRRLIQSLLLGFIGAIVLYNLIIAGIARDEVFGLNAAVILCIVGIDLYLSGVGAQWLWPKALSNLALNTALLGTCAVGALFIRRFLSQTPDDSSVLIPLKWLAFAALSLYLTQFLVPYWFAQSGLLLAIIILLFYAPYVSIRMALEGSVRARLLLFPLGLAIVPGSLGVLLRTVLDFELGALRPHMLEITLAIEALAFSLALAALIRVHAADAATAKSELLNTQLRSAETFADLQDRERARIASDLHDSIGHNLVLAKSLLEPGEDEDDKYRAEEAAAIIHKTLSSVRRLSHELHPAALKHLGWEGAVSSLFATLTDVHQIEADLRQDGGPPPLDQRGQTHLYRILQEAISNIVRHSDATHCDAKLVRSETEFNVRIADNGTGIQQGESDPSGLGLTSIAERVRALGGMFDRHNQDAGGLVLVITIPLAKQTEDLA